MELNIEKSNYIIFPCSKANFTTRITIDDQCIERMDAYMRVPMLTNLKYVGIQTEELLNIYILLIRSVTVYSSVLFHSSLTQEQSDSLETRPEVYRSEGVHKIVQVHRGFQGALIKQRGGTG